jgi:hypothetical protein
MGTVSETRAVSAGQIIDSKTMVVPAEDIAALPYLGVFFHVQDLDGAQYAWNGTSYVAGGAGGGASSFTQLTDAPAPTARAVLGFNAAEELEAFPEPLLQKLPVTYADTRMGATPSIGPIDVTGIGAAEVGASCLFLYPDTEADCGIWTIASKIDTLATFERRADSVLGRAFYTGEVIRSLDTKTDYVAGVMDQLNGVYVPSAALDDTNIYVEWSTRETALNAVDPDPTQMSTVQFIVATAERQFRATLATMLKKLPGYVEGAALKIVADEPTWVAP